MKINNRGDIENDNSNVYSINPLSKNLNFINVSDNLLEKNNDVEQKKEIVEVVTLDKVEKLRIDALKNLTKLLVRFILLFLFIYIIFGNSLEYLVWWDFILPVAAAILYNRRKKKVFIDEYKKYFVLKALNEIFDEIYFDIDNGINRRVIANTKMMKMGDEFNSNDYVRGYYKDVFFQFSDVHIKKSYMRDGKTRYVTLFKGQWFIFNFNKCFKSNIQVCEKSFSNAKRTKSLFDEENNYKKIELEDIEFNKKFNVYAQNELDAFYVLNPNSIQRIKELNKRIRGSFLFCFVDNRLHIGLSNNNDNFKASIFKKIDEESEKKKIYNELKIVVDFIDLLNLDNTLFKV